jgi:hypothetical protein
VDKWANILALMTLTACGSAGRPKAFAVDHPHDYVDAARTTRAITTTDQVVVAPEVIEGFQFLYQFVTETEFVLCLEGTASGGRIYVTSFRLARMTASTANAVKYDPCTSQHYVGTAHNHPPVPNNHPPCYQSALDRNSFLNDTRAIVDIVLCGRTTYLWVLKDGRKSIKGGNLVASGR